MPVELRHPSLEEATRPWPERRAMLRSFQPDDDAWSPAAARIEARKRAYEAEMAGEIRFAQLLRSLPDAVFETREAFEERAGK